MHIIIVEKVFKSCFSTVLFYWEEQCHSKEEKVTRVYLQTIKYWQNKICDLDPNHQNSICVEPSIDSYFLNITFVFSKCLLTVKYLTLKLPSKLQGIKWKENPLKLIPQIYEEIRKEVLQDFDNCNDAGLSIFPLSAITIVQGET